VSMKTSLLVGALVCFASLITEPALANPECSTEQQFYGSLTNLKGKREGIISNRHQEHLWMTDDGVFHALINSGKKRNALQLFSSINGVDWFLRMTFSNTNHRSHPDGFLKNETLWITYSSSSNHILLHKLSYNSEDNSWLENDKAKVYKKFGFVPDRPTVTLDRKNQVWIAFSELNQKTDHTLIKVIKVNNMEGLNCCALFPATFSISNHSKRKSAKILALEDKIVLIYTDQMHVDSAKADHQQGHSLNWAYMHLEEQSSEWINGGALFQYKQDENDPHGTHFNVAKDSFDNIHVVTASEKKIIYLRIKNSHPIHIDSANAITHESSPPYMQIAISENNEIYVVYPARCLSQKKLNFHVKILKSYDLGETFQKIATLSLDREDHPGNPRLEIQSTFKRTLSVLWQIRQKNGRYAIVSFLI